MFIRRKPLLFCSPVFLDFSIGLLLVVWQVMPRILHQPLVSQVEDSLILGYHYAVLDREVLRRVVVEQRFVVTVAHDAHHRLD